MGIRERKQREFEKRKNLIISTAQELFSKSGFVGVTLDDIAAKIEFSKGTIYSHFDSKEEIVAQILLAQLNNLLAMLQESARSSRTADEGIRRCLQAYRQFYQQNPEYFQLLFFVDIFSNRYRIPEPLLEEIQMQKVACLQEFQKVLARGISARELQKHHSAKELAFVLWGMLNGILQLATSQQVRQEELDPLIMLALDIVMQGLKEPKEKN
jgi:AcrR family transcriptional regulator